MNKIDSVQYIVNNNPVCSDCARGNLEQIRTAAGLYQVIKEIVSGDKNIWSSAELDKLVDRATSF